jgi:putative PIN family toxin of toxin-antitoxin system
VSEPSGEAEVPRVVLDTNVLVAAAYDRGSASRRLVDACLRGELAAVVSPALVAEYRHILPRAVRVHGYDEELSQLIENGLVVEPADVPRVVPEDPDDDKLAALAVAAGAVALVTNDEHLLRLDPLAGVRVVRPPEFLRLAPLR